MPHPVYLVRHGQSQWNLRRLTQGQTAHPPLTELGRAQSAAAAELIAADLEALGLTATRLVTSDLVRAVETAGVIGRRLQLTPQVDPRLREQHLGDLEGRSYDETWSAAESVDWSDPSQPIAGGESLMEVHDRMAAVVEELDRDSVCVLVSHGDAIRSAVAYLEGVKPHEAAWVEVANGAVARVADDLSWLV